MRRRFGVAAVSLSLAAAVLLAGCSGGGGGGGGSTGGGGVPSPTPGGSTENPTPENPDNPGGSGGKKDDGTSEEPALSLYEPVDSKKTVRSFSSDYQLYIVIDYSAAEGESGRYAKFRGPYSHFTKGASDINPLSNPTLVDSIPEDYLKDSQNLISNYVWDCYDKKILHVKNSKGSTPIDSSKWEYRDGYKYICEIGGGNQITKVRNSPYYQGLENFDGWCTEEDVDSFVNRTDLWPIKLIALDGCPFQSNLKIDPHSSTSGYYLYNGKVYFEYNN